MCGQDIKTASDRIIVNGSEDTLLRLLDEIATSCIVNTSHEQHRKGSDQDSNL